MEIHYLYIVQSHSKISRARYFCEWINVSRLERKSVRMVTSCVEIRP